jgi:hypothetical protein
VKDPLARRLAKWSFIVAGSGLLISGCQAIIAYQQLQDSRRAAIKIEADNPTGMPSQPEVLMRISNLLDRPINNAKVAGHLALLPPESAAEIFRDMADPVVETVQPRDSEPQHLHADGPPYSDAKLAEWASGDLVLVGALVVNWKDRGSWISSEAKRCWAWTMTGGFACEDLIGKTPNEARAQVKRFLAEHPNGVAIEPGQMTK